MRPTLIIYYYLDEISKHYELNNKQNLNYDIPNFTSSNIEI